MRLIHQHKQWWLLVYGRINDSQHWIHPQIATYSALRESALIQKNHHPNVSETFNLRYFAVYPNFDEEKAWINHLELDLFHSKYYNELISDTLRYSPFIGRNPQVYVTTEMVQVVTPMLFRILVAWLSTMLLPIDLLVTSTRAWDLAAHIPHSVLPSLDHYITLQRTGSRPRLSAS